MWNKLHMPDPRGYLLATTGDPRALYHMNYKWDHQGSVPEWNVEGIETYVEILSRPGRHQACAHRLVREGRSIAGRVPAQERSR